MSDTVAEFLKRIDKARDVNRLVHEMQSEIDRLRQDLEQKNLTDAEREAVADAADAYEYDDEDEECGRIAATLRGLLERTK